MNVQMVNWSPRKPSKTVDDFLKRPAFDAAAQQVADEVLDAIQAKGMPAVLKYARDFDHVRMRAADVRVGRAELAEARQSVPADTKAAIREAHKRVAAFAVKGQRADWRMPSPRGGRLGEQFHPLERAGVYVPGGAAPLVSTAVMTITLARVAGVKEIVVCTPCDARKVMHPALLYAMELCGATEIYRLGGIQAIGAMAYGAGAIRPVQKIVGPGGTFVTAAKRRVYGTVALDMVAGPSEIAVLADTSARPDFVAADLLSQAEHGTGYEKALLVTSSARLARAVQDALVTQAAALSRQKPVAEVMRRGMLLVVTPTLDAGMELCNRFAAEHLELMVKEPTLWLRKVRCAGAVFVGPWSPECVGDFVAGPSHVLPTGGTAAMFSGLTVDDFRRRTSVIAFTRADLLDALPVVEAFGAIEGLDGHANSARIRFMT